MGTESLQGPPMNSENLGSWHPAWRPDTQTSRSGLGHKDFYGGNDTAETLADSTESSALDDVPSASTNTQLQPQPDLPQEDQEVSEPHVPPKPSISDDSGNRLGAGVVVIQGQEQNSGTLRPTEHDLVNDGDGTINPEVVTESERLGQTPLPLEENAPYEISETTVDEPSGISWAMENQVNPVWGVSPETFEIGSSRPMLHTNSFPEVPPLRSISGLPPAHALPQSQVEGIMEENEAETLGYDEGYTFESGADIYQQEIDSFQNSVIGEGETDFNNAVANTQDFTTTPPDDEAKFEEGLPLLPAKPSANALTDNQSDVFFGSDSLQQGHDEDFFAQASAGVPSEASVFKPSQLDRKTTHDVLSSMTYQSRSEIHDCMPEYEKPPTLENLTGGGIAVSTNTVVSRILADKAMASESAGKTEPEAAPAAKEDDLAAMWQAALADDDFLEEESSVDPTGFFYEDGEGFLDETQASPPVPQPVIGSNGKIQGFSNISRGNNGPFSAEPSSQARYAPQQGQSVFAPANPPLSSQSPYAPTGFPTGFAPSGFNEGLGQQPPYSNQSSISRPGMPEKTQSFANKSKGGYTSPYDLPMDVSRPKRRAGLQHLQNTGFREMGGIPPPRSSSMQTTMAIPPARQSPYQPAPVNVPGPGMSPSMSTSMPFSPNPTVPKVKPKPPTGSFFEELPIAAKPRPPSSVGRFVPQPNQPAPPPQQFPPLHGQFDQNSRPPPQPASVSQAYQLVPPQRVLPFAVPNQPAAPNQAFNAPPYAAPTPPTLPHAAANTRYSPAPPGQPHMPTNRNRYSTPPVPSGPPVRPPSVSQILSFQPRTSSPLARSASASQQSRLSSQPELPSFLNEHLPAGSRRPSLRSTLTEQHATPNMGNAHQSNFPVSTVNQSSSDFNPGPRPQYHHPLQQSQLMSPNVRAFDAPPRSQTQSPGAVTARTEQSASLNKAKTTGPSLLAGANFMVPSDGREQDLLERWKGCPVFNFGFGGHVVTSFPKQIPRYAAGQLVPMIKCTAGEVRVHSGKIIPLDEHISMFPGPLKSKGKKKDVLAWLEKGIMRLEQQRIPVIPNQTPMDARKRQEEKIILWKILHVLVEHDGAVDGNPAAEKAVRQILSPELAFAGPADQLSYESNIRPRGISSAGVSQNARSSQDPENIENLRKLLLEGEREKAVWHAVDKQLWGHAMLIASTLAREIWKQVAQEFVRLEVRGLGENVESLAALYDVFSGNWEESVDELVPPSARAGLQMVSKIAGSGPMKNALDGLDRWRETLSLILSNRSTDDSKALIALGQLLSGYGRVEAAHICYIFSKAPGLFGGPDDPLASITLLGADHIKQAFDYGRDLDSVLITEIYEFAFAVLAPSTVSTIAPHLQAHKLHHAMLLAEYGYREEAQQYCDAIMSALKATTKPSPYYHAQLFGSLEDLTSRLRQAPKDGSSSWISRPNMDKVSGSVWNRLNQFISGDDSDAASTGSANALASEAGPFAKIAGDTPSISRAQSPDVYGPYVNGDGYTPVQSAAPPAPANSRYTPAGTYTPRTSSEQAVRPSPEAQRSYHLESLKKADLQRQSSYASLPTLSPDLYRKQPPDSYQQMQRPASSATFSPESESHPPPSSMYSNQPANQSQHGLYNPEPHFSQPDYQATHSTSEGNQESLSMLQHLSPRSVDNRSPYEPRSATYQTVRSPSSVRQRSPAYAPLSASSEPRTRSYQPSPVSDKPLPAAPYTPPDSYEPQPSYAPPKPPMKDVSYEPQSSYEPLSASIVPPADEPPSASYAPPPDGLPSTYHATPSDEPPSASFESPSYGYKPPTSSSYEPPSYDPETQNGEISPVQEKPKKKSYLDDDEDDDIVTKAAALKKAEKAKKDREADEAFRKAAEADAQKDSGKSASKGGWLSGWLPVGKAKEPNSKAPIRARLGEESSFVYDETLKKWVNKKAGAEAPNTSAPTPPPPRGPPSRAASAAGGPPTSLRPPPLPSGRPSSAAPSRNVSPLIQRGESPSTPGAVTDTMRELPAVLEDAGIKSELGLEVPRQTPSASRPPSAPPSRPATGMSNASSIDDLIGAPQARKGGTVKGKKKGRGYVDVMAK
ncbi:vesicle coat component [Trapelia coarctata]|nr:vesicle coat component [Trapelia coarctata]